MRRIENKNVILLCRTEKFTIAYTIHHFHPGEKKTNQR